VPSSSKRRCGVLGLMSRSNLLKSRFACTQQLGNGLNTHLHTHLHSLTPPGIGSRIASSSRVPFPVSLSSHSSGGTGPLFRSINDSESQEGQ